MGADRLAQHPGLLWRQMCVRVLVMTQAGVPAPGARQWRSLGGNPKTLSSPTFQGLTAWGSAAQAGSQGKFFFPQHLPC